MARHHIASLALCTALALVLGGCAQQGTQGPGANNADAGAIEASAVSRVITDTPWKPLFANMAGQVADYAAKQLNPFGSLNITEDFRTSFDHGPKGAEYQKYIVLHDTEGDSDASSVINWWDSNGNLIASHFIINKDGSIVQAVPIDRIAHHAGFGNAGHNDQYGIVEDGRDDMRGTSPIGSWAPDYGMNAWSIGIELVHVGGSGGYPQAQLDALDALIAALDTYYGFESQIIDHKDSRSGNSDTSPEFATYLANYKDHRTWA